MILIEVMISKRDIDSHPAPRGPRRMRGKEVGGGYPVGWDPNANGCWRR